MSVKTCPGSLSNAYVGESLDRYPPHRDRFWALLKSCGVTAYLTGHTHNFSAVQVDGDSTKDCAPNSAPATACADPNRANNPSAADWLTILDSPKTVGRIAASSVFSANFLVKVADPIPADSKVEMVLGVSARKSGKPTESYAVSRHKLDKDEVSFFYSTDFLTGGTEDHDTKERVHRGRGCRQPVPSRRPGELDYGRARHQPPR